MSTQAEKLQRFAALTNRLGWDLCIEYDDQKPEFHQEGRVLSPVGITSTIAMLASGANLQDAEMLCQRIGIDGTEDLELVETVLRELGGIPKSMAFLFLTAWFTNNKALLDSEYGAAIRKFRASIISQDKSKPTLASQINDWVKEEFPIFPHVMCSVEGSSNWHIFIGNVLNFTALSESEFDLAQTCKMPFETDNWVEVDALFKRGHAIKPMLENLGILLSGKLPDLGEGFQNLDEILHSVYFEVNEGGAALPDQAGLSKVDDVDVSWKELRLDEQFMFTVHNRELNIAVLMGFYNWAYITGRQVQVIIVYELE
ncbi:Serpin domain-containing protein [Aspergillus stella-maris]|uniref:Serpin domain-containing protein n=1 Tax=Aspergillus stella-maris TaxID=1810926 RepID=UPI003CCDDDE1